MSAQPFRAPAGQLRNPLGELLCGYTGQDPDAGPGHKAICLHLDPCEEHGAQDPVPLSAGVPVVTLPPTSGDSIDVPPVPALDLHDQLKDDDHDWSVRTRLTASLGRPALATRLADALPPLLGAELADRLDHLITQALSEQQARITQELSDRYHEARARLDADAQAKLKEVHDERYRGHSRLS
jgi:hypothetical protein